MAGTVAKHPGERRVWPRVRLKAEAILRFEALDERIRSRIINASENGLMLAVPSPRPVGTPMGITVFFANPRQEVRVEGVVVHVATRSPLYDNALPTCLGIYLTEAGEDWGKICASLTVYTDSSHRKT